MAESRTFRVVVLALLIAVYAAIRLWGLTDTCLWFDEIFSVHAAEHDWGTIWNFVALDLIHPPFFYILLKFWIAAGGDELFWLRLFPAFWSIVAIYPFLRLCGELKIGKWTRLLALFLFAVNGSLIKYSQEVRMYAPLMCLSLFSIWLFARYFVKGKSFVALVIVNLLMIYTHYFGWFVIVTEVMLIVWFQRIKWRRIAVMFGIAVIAFVPWLIALIMASHSGSALSQNIGWMPRPGLAELGTLVLSLVEPFYAQTSTAQPVSIYSVSLPMLVILIAASAALSAVILRRTADTETYVLLSFVKVPVWLCLTASWVLPYSIWGTRHLIIVFAPLCIFFAVAIASITDKRVRVAAVTLLLLFSGYAGVLDARRATPMNSWCAWQQLTSETENVPIYATDDLIAYHIWFNHRTDQNAEVFKLSGVEGVTEDNAYFLPRGFGGVQPIEFEMLNEPKLWLAFRSPSVSENEPPLRQFLVRGYQVIEKRTVKTNSETAAFYLLRR